MNKIKLVALLAVCGFSGIAIATPSSFAVFTNNTTNKIVRTISDCHADTKANIDNDLPYIDIIQKTLDHVSSNSNESCWVIENSTNDEFTADTIKKYEEGKIEKTLLDHLLYIAVKNRYRLSNIQFNRIFHQKKCKLFGAMYEFTSLAFNELAKNQNDHDLIIIGQQLYKWLAHRKLEFPFTFQTFYDDLDQEIEELKKYIESELPSSQTTFLKGLMSKVEKVREDFIANYKAIKELVPDCADQPWLDALHNIWQAGIQENIDQEEENREETIFDNFYINIVAFVEHVGNMNFIIQITDLLKEQDDLTIYIGKSHADMIAEFLSVIGFEKKFEKNGSIKVVDDFTPLEEISDGAEAPDNVVDCIFSVEEFVSLCREWMCKEPIMPAGFGRVKADAESKTAAEAAGLRPGEPMSAVLAGAARSAVPVKMAAAAAAAGKKLVKARKANTNITAGRARGVTKSKICLFCGKRAKSCCSLCKKTYYCSEKCQTRHWPKHKLSCKAAI